MIKIKVPGRICFFGDHQDYLQLPIIAGTINRYITLSAFPIATSELRIALLDLGVERKITLPYSKSSLAPNDYFCSGLLTLQKLGIMANKGFEIKISGDLPINAGVSSSSALVVAWIRFLLQAYAPEKQHTNKQVAQWAVATEVINFQQPGGIMDQFTIAHGGLGFLDIPSQNWHPLNAKLGQLVLAVSGIEKQTLSVLQNARDFALHALKLVQEEDPQFQLQEATAASYEHYVQLLPKELQPYWYAAIQNHEITKRAKQLLNAPTLNLKALGDLMNQHQNILRNCIQNTPDAMHQMLQAALAAGALGAKIIGSGGGGAMVALTDKNCQEKIINAFKAASAVAAFPVELSPSNP